MTIAASAAAAAALAAVPALMASRDGGTQTLAQHPTPAPAASAAPNPQQLLRTVLAALGPTARAVGTGEQLKTGVLTSAEAGRTLAGRTRKAGASVTVTVPRAGAGDWTVVAFSQLLEPALPPQRVPGLAAPPAAEPTPLVDDILPSGARAVVYSTAFGAFGAAASGTGLVTTVEVASGSGKPDGTAMAAAAAAVLRAAG